MIRIFKVEKDSFSIILLIDVIVCLKISKLIIIITMIMNVLLVINLMTLGLHADALL